MTQDDQGKRWFLQVALPIILLFALIVLAQPPKPVCGTDEIYLSSQNACVIGHR
jgi:hypothetical protein